MAREFYKGIDELQHLLALQQRLNRLMSATRVGGKAGIERLVKLANVELKKQYPDINELKVDDFSGAYHRRHGVTSATISRTGKTAAGMPDGTFTVAVLEIPEKGDPTVKIRVKTMSWRQDVNELKCPRWTYFRWHANSGTSRRPLLEWRIETSPGREK